MTKIVGKIKRMKDTSGGYFFPVTSSKAVILEDGERLEDVVTLCEDMSDETIEVEEPSIIEDVNTWIDFRNNGGTIGGATQFEGDIAVIRHDNQTNFEFGKSTFTGQSAYIGLRDRGTGASMGLNFNIKPGLSSSISPLEHNGTDLGKWDFAWKDVWIGTYAKIENGFAKLSNGLIMQWGEIKYEDYGHSGIKEFLKSCNFPVSFPNELLSATLTPFTNKYDQAKIKTMSVRYDLSDKSTLNTVITVESEGSWHTKLKYIAIGY